MYFRKPQSEMPQKRMTVPSTTMTNSAQVA